MIMAIYYSGELVWRDRERKVHEIIDASSTPDWTFLVPKTLALILVLASICWRASSPASRSRSSRATPTTSSTNT